MRLSLVFLLTIVAITQLGCRTNPVYEVNTIRLNDSLSYAPQSIEIERAIVRVATSLGWSIRRAEAGRLIATLKVRSHRAVAEITHDDSTFSIRYRDSDNLKYDGDSIHSNYNSWIQRLEKAIITEMKTATRR